MGNRRKARECALQMLFAADVTKQSGDIVTRIYWEELGEPDTEDFMRDFSIDLTLGVLDKLEAVDDQIRIRAEHWRIERMAIVDRNVLRLAVYEFLFGDTPNPIVINEALELARRFRPMKPLNLSTEFLTPSDTI